MKKFYFGAWQNFYHLGWPVRFLIEEVVFLGIVFALYKLIRKRVQKSRLRPYLVKGCAWVATEAVYFVGKNNPWAVKTDHKVMEWMEKKLKPGTEEAATAKKHFAVKIWAVTGMIILYILAVFVDLPVSKYLQEEYLAEFVRIKDFFQKYEKAISRGYEEYPPLFVKREPEKEEEVVGEPEEKEKIPIYIQLNETGKRGANVRKEPSLDGEIVGGVNSGFQILYQYEWERDVEERVWIKIFVPAEGVEGWLSGKLVEEGQLQELVAETEP